MNPFPLQPVNPVFPLPTEVNLPKKLDPLPLIDINDSYWKRLKDFLFERPKFVTTVDYITWIEPFGCWMWCPPNFVYDFASVPKLIPLINPAGVFAYPALPHDFIYRFGGLLVTNDPDKPFQFMEFSRSEGDKIFKAQAKRANGLGMLDSIATSALTVCGGANYKPRNIYDVDWTSYVYATE